MPNLTQKAFLEALEDKFTAEELVELLDLKTSEIITAFFHEVLKQQNMLEEELKYGH
jgi:hypothetical protein